MINNLQNPFVRNIQSGRKLWIKETLPKKEKLIIADSFCILELITNLNNHNENILINIMIFQKVT